MKTLTSVLVSPDSAVVAHSVSGVGVLTVESRVHPARDGRPARLALTVNGRVVDESEWPERA